VGEGVLDVSSIEARCFAIERQACSLSDIIDEALEAWSDQRERFDVSVDDRAAEPTWLDPGRICQVLTNLLSNAAKYGTPGSRIHVRATGGAGHIEVSVKNVGRAVSQAELDRVFERYARSRESRKAPGLGLGLFICRGIVEAHGGRISASSEGDEVTFRVVLPLRDPDEGS
jgi:signal transduction histidine kinase